jgi:Tir chaperone protein (CesT) family
MPNDIVRDIESETRGGTAHAVTMDQLSTLMTQLGEKLDCQSVSEYPAHKSWIVVLDDVTAFELAFDDQIALLHVVSEVASLPGQDRQRQLEMLLQYNNEWPRTGGLRFSLDAAGEKISLVASFPATGLEPTWLAQRLRRLAEMVNDWQRLIADGRGDGAAPAAAEGTTFAEHLIRI